MADASPAQRSRLLGPITLAIAGAAIIGHLHALGSWWALDDWGQLARAAGLDSGTSALEFPARWLSQHFYWSLTWPLFGLAANAHAVIRLLIHALAAILVLRIARRAGLGSVGGLLSGLIFAASPIAFTPLYWASGSQELLAGVLALGAVDCWLAGKTGGRSRLAWATLLAVLSMLSKEAGLGLPLLFLVFAWLRLGVRLEDKAFAWAMIMLLLAAAVTEGALVASHFDTTPGAAYETGGLGRMLANLGAVGWWLLSPGPILASRIMPLMTLTGYLVFLVWALWGILAWRRQRSPFVLLTWFAALLAVAPALPLRTRLVPYLTYLAVAPLGLALGAAVEQIPWRPLREPARPALIGFLFLAATAWSFLGMKTRLDNRNELGLAADPVVRATSLSWQACRTMADMRDQAALTGGALSHLTLLQPLVDPQAQAMARSLGESWTQRSDMYQALAGVTGPRLFLGDATRVVWANGLTGASSQALVLCETRTGFRVWGRTANALLYAALTNIGLGQFEQARAHLARAASLGSDQIMFIFDEGQMVIPLKTVLDQRAAFTDWTLGLLDAGASRLEVGGLQDLFFNLLRSATGRSLDELTAGSRLLAAPPTPQP